MTEKFSNLNLTEYEKDYLEDLCEEYPNFENMSRDELDKLAEELFWKAMGLINEGTQMENKAEAIREFLSQTEKNGG